MSCETGGIFLRLVHGPTISGGHRRRSDVGISADGFSLSGRDGRGGAGLGVSPNRAPHSLHTGPFNQTPGEWLVQ